MSEYDIRQSGDVAKTIIDALKGFFEQIIEAVNYLKRLPEYFRDLRKDITDGFSNLINAQGEMEIYIRMSKVKSKSSLIDAENEAIEDFSEQLNDDLHEIDQRYKKIHADLNDQCKKRIREIDEHLLEIPDKFPKEMYSTFNEEIMPLLQNLVNDASIAYTERLQALKIAVEKTRAVINNFIKVRNGFFEKVSNYEISEEITKTKEMFLPVWICEIENTKNNSNELHAIIPGEMEKVKLNGSNKVNIEYIPDISLEPIHFILHAETKKEFLKKKINWKEDKYESSRISKDTLMYIEKIDKRQTVKKALKKIIDNSHIKFIKEVV